MSTTREQWQAKYKSLPPELQEAISSTDIDEALEKIGTDFRLHIDQAGKLAVEVNAVMMGDLPPQQFISHLRESLNTDAETAKNIAKEVNEKIFLAVRESLKKIHEVGIEKAKHSHKEKLEPKKDIVHAIEAPEEIPMKEKVFPATPPPQRVEDPYRELPL